MEKKKGDVCIINKAIFTKDSNHPKGFTIPVNTRLIIDGINSKYFLCTCDNGYKIGIELEHDNSLVIITDNKKINKFKEQLATYDTSKIKNIDFEKESKIIIKRKTWNIEVIEYSDGTIQINRTNDGFTIIELTGLIAHTQFDLANQWKGTCKADIIERKVVEPIDSKDLEIH